MSLTTDEWWEGQRQPRLLRWLIEVLSPLWKNRKPLLGCLLYLALWQSQSYWAHWDLLSFCPGCESSGKWLSGAEQWQIFQAGIKGEWVPETVGKSPGSQCFLLTRQLSFIAKCWVPGTMLGPGVSERKKKNPKTKNHYPREAELGRKMDEKMKLGCREPCSS